MHPNVFVWKQVGWKMKKLSFIVTFPFTQTEAWKPLSINTETEKVSV